MDTNTITTAQAARLLGVSPQTVQKWVDAGVLPAWKTVGGHRRLDADAVGRMVATRRTAVPATRGLSIIVVDDDAATASVLAAQLRDLHPDATLRVFGDGFSALLDAGREAPDVLIADIDLPGLDGLAMVRQLADNPATQRMRIVLTTGPDADAARQGELPAGVALLRKPLSAALLAEAIGR